MTIIILIIIIIIIIKRISRAPIYHTRWQHRAIYNNTNHTHTHTHTHTTSDEGMGRALIGGSCHKYPFCPDKHVFVVTKLCLSRKTFVATTIILSRQP